MKRLLIALGAGIAVAVAWFVHLSQFGVNQRLRGDAGGYLRIAAGFKDWGDAFSYVGDRSVGFPLVMRVFVGLSPALNSQQAVASFLSVTSMGLFTIHVLSVIALVFALRRRIAEAPLLPLGALLLAYPGLVGHTTVPLADTFCADLVMLALAALAVGARWSPFVTGGVLAFAALCRPSYNPALILSMVLLIVAPAVITRTWRTSVPGAAMFGAYLLLLTPFALHCQSRFGQLCLMDPSVGKTALEASFVNGLDSPRLYWSSHVPPQEDNPNCGPACRTLRDPTLTRTWADHCHIDSTALAYGLPRCFLTRPDLALLFLWKKTLALYDAYHYQPYVTDLTPRWARLWSRPFSALSYAGFVFALGGLVVLARRRITDPLLLSAFLITATLTGVHSVTHIEARYGFGAIPGALLAVCLAWHAPERRRQLRIAAVSLACVFLLQTGSWDQQDQVLQRIEAAQK